jgi:hypothetical protein
MINRRILALLALMMAAALFAVSQRQPPQAPPAARVIEPATVPATQPQAVTLQVDQQPVVFPPAVLRLSVSGDHLNARLSTDDPPEAIQDNYHGNSFDLIMALNVPDAADIDKAVWAYTADPSVPAQRESGYGIFLDGQRTRLHPQDVLISFAREGDRILVDVKGMFFEYQSPDTARPTSAPPRVLVEGRLLANVEKN